MLVSVEPEHSRDLREIELRRHLHMMAHAIERAATGFTLTMILRSPASDPAKALVGMTGALQRAGLSAKIVVARVDPEDELRQLHASLSALAPQANAPALIRCLRNPRLLDAHEQVIYGETMCWSGDAMRRDADRRNALSLFDDQSTDSAQLGRLAFAALWAASAPVPERYLSGVLHGRPSGAYERPLAEAPVSISPSAAGPQGWPLLRH
jgi:hypothetical protein